MFAENLFSSFFRDPFFAPPSLVNKSQRSQSTACRTNYAGDECSRRGSRDIFDHFSRAADRLFESATQAFFQDVEMFPRHFYPSYLRDPPSVANNVNHRVGVTLNGDLVERRTDTFGSRPYRHTSNDRVQFERTRLHWYDSNTRRALVPPPAPPRPEPSGRLTRDELAKLPISVYRVQQRSPGQQGDSTGNSSFSSGTEASPVIPVRRNPKSVPFSPSMAYLDPISRNSSVVEIQPLQSSPSRGHPECEVCLTEYQNKDQLRHLPCGHAFHKKCIDAWFNQSSTCPKCRAGVRTGLKRLERTRNRSCGPPRNAPVRAIRDRSTGSIPTNSRTCRRSTQPNQRSEDNRIGSDEMQNSTGGSEGLTPGSGSSSSGSPVRNEHCRMANPGSPLFTSHENQSYLATSRSRRPGGPQAATNSTRIQGSANSERSSRIMTEAEKSLLARRKAAEAAIRRAERAQRERSENPTN